MPRELAPTSYAETWQSYLDTTSIVGLNRVQPSPFSAQRIYWFVIVVVGVFATAYHAYSMMNTYMM